MLPPILIDFKKKNPDIPVNFTLSFFPNIIEMLNQDIISFALIPEDDETLHNSTYVCREFYDDDMVAVFPPEHPLAAYERIPAEELLNYPFLISQAQSATRKFILSRLSFHGIHISHPINMYNTETIKQSVMNGMGISILSKISVEKEEDNGYLKTAPLDGVNLYRKWYLIHRKNRILQPECNLFMQRVLSKEY